MLSAAVVIGALRVNLKVPDKNCSRQYFSFIFFYFFFCFFFYFSKKIRLEDSCESSPQQRIPMIYQILFSLKKKNEKVFMNVVCCSRDWGFKG